MEHQDHMMPKKEMMMAETSIMQMHPEKHSAPSFGLTKAQKSGVVKKAIAGKDIKRKK